MPNSRFKIVGDEFLTAIDYDDEFHVNLLFDHSIYRPMCTHMGNYSMEIKKLGGLKTVLRLQKLKFKL